MELMSTRQSRRTCEQMHDLALNVVNATVPLDGTDSREATGYAYENHH